MKFSGNDMDDGVAAAVAAASFESFDINSPPSSPFINASRPSVPPSASKTQSLGTSLPTPSKSLPIFSSIHHEDQGINSQPGQATELLWKNDTSMITSSNIRSNNLFNS